MMRAIIPLLALLAAGAAAGQGGPAAQPPAQVQGRDLFHEKCGGCHLAGGFGTRVLARRVPDGEGELEKRSRLPAALVKLAVRQGIGSMPSIRRTELGDAELDAIARYLEKGR